MLLRGITLMTMILSVLLCLDTGLAVGQLILRYTLTFGLVWLGLLAAAVLFLVAVSYAVDPDREQEQDSPFYRWVIRVYVEALIMLLRVKTDVTGMEKLPQAGRFLLVCNHQFAADPGILLDNFRSSQLAFISKQENRKLFCVGRLMHKILCQELDRGDDRQALRVIRTCIGILQSDKASVAVFPEGGTNHDELLHPFRPGVFRIAQKAQVPIVVCTLRGTRQVLKNALRPGGSRVALHLVEVIEPERFAGMTTVQISDMVYGMMARDLGAELVAGE